MQMVFSYIKKYETVNTYSKLFAEEILQKKY